MRIVEMNDAYALRELRDAWRDLQSRCPDATPFQTWEWNEAWWAHFGARKRLRLLLFHARGATGDEELVGIAPLYSSFHLGSPLRRLAWIGTGAGDYLEPLATRERAVEVARQLTTYLETRMRGWDIADLQQLRVGTPLLTTGSSHLIEGSRSLLPMEPCPYLALPPTWEEFAKRLGKKMRSNLGYYERLLERTFTNVESFQADESNVDDGMTALFELHQQRWNARWLPGVLGNRRVREFHREVARRFLANGWLRLHLLRIDGAYRSALYCFTFGPRTYYYLGGFSPELSRYSLGTLLTARAIKMAISEGHSEFDFLRGHEPYKYRWSPEERVNSRLVLLRSRPAMGSLGTIPGRAGLALNRAERIVEVKLKEFAENQGRKAKGKAAEPTAELPASAVVHDRGAESRTDTVARR